MKLAAGVSTGMQFHIIVDNYMSSVSEKQLFETNRCVKFYLRCSTARLSRVR